MWVSLKPKHCRQSCIQKDQPNPQEATLSTETVRKHYTNDLPISSLISSGQKTQQPTLSAFTILLWRKKKGTRAFKRITKIKAVSGVIIYHRNNNHMNNCHNKQKKSFQNSVFLNHSIKSKFQLQPPWIKNPTNPPKTKWIDHLKTLNSHRLKTRHFRFNLPYRP